MSPRPYRGEIKIRLSESIDDVFAKLVDRKNVGRDVTVNQIRYENLGPEGLVHLPHDARSVIQMSFLDKMGAHNSQIWGIESVYSTLADVLQLAQQKKVALTLAHPLDQKYRELPSEDFNRARLLRTRRVSENHVAAPLSLFLMPGATVIEEAAAVRELLSAAQISLLQAYQDDVWPQMDPAEVSEFYGNQTLSWLRESYQRSVVRQELFGTDQPETSRSLR